MQLIGIHSYNRMLLSRVLLLSTQRETAQTASRRDTADAKTGKAEVRTLAPDAPEQKADSHNHQHNGEETDKRPFKTRHEVLTGKRKDL